MWNPSPHNWFNAGTGAALAILGIYCLWVRPRRPANKSLGLFLLFFGLSFVTTNANISMTGDAMGGAEMATLTFICYMGAIVSVIRFALQFPTQWRPPRRTLLWLGALPLLSSAAMVFWSGLNLDFFAGSGVELPLLSVLARTTFYILLNCMLLAMMLMIWRRRVVDHHDSHALALAAVGLMPYVALIGVGDVMRAAVGTAAGDWGALLFVPLVSSFIGPFVLGIQSVRTMGGPSSRFIVVAHMMILLIAAFLVTSLAYDNPSSTNWAAGIARLVMALLLTVAVLKGQLLGLERGAKWTLRQSTLAAIALAIFFIVSEAAQQFFGDRAGNQYLGIAAAGVLVLGMAPLQRLADRVADTALPDARPVDKMTEVERHSAYNRVLRAAWSDGILSQDERRLLEKVRGELSIADADAMGMEKALFADGQPPNTHPGVAAM